MVLIMGNAGFISSTALGCSGRASRRSGRFSDVGLPYYYLFYGSLGYGLALNPKRKTLNHPWLWFDYKCPQKGRVFSVQDPGKV